MTDRIDAPMDAMEVAPRHPLAYAVLGQPEGLELAQRDHPVLARRERGDGRLACMAGILARGA